MITVFYCARQANPKHSKHIKDTCGVKNVEVIEYINNGEGLTAPFNYALQIAKYNIVVFIHDDVEFMTKNWGRKLINHYKRNPEYGILGVAGTKYMSETGRWWDKRKKMYGQVYHTHEGKTWLSKYSEHLGNKITDTVIVDGVFFSVHKERIKKHFNPDIKGFHFYDVDFCFQNYLEGVKIGVHFDIKINHMSIGETNDEWEENRKIFVEKYKDHLPVHINKTFETTKLKVLIGCLNFNSFTGSELYVFELAKELTKQNCEVTIYSNCGGELAKKASTYGIKMCNLDEPPGFKLGDGKWELVSPQGQRVKSVKNQLYKLSEVDFDIIHCNHKPITEKLLLLYPDIDMISTIHSEVIELEHPVIHNNIKKYIAIRPEIKDFLIEKFEIPEDKIEVIYNPIDYNRFKPRPKQKKSDKKTVLFIGTMDYLRENTIKDLIKTTKAEGKKLLLIGKNNGIDMNFILQGQDHVTYMDAVWNVENYIRECDETAGILLGRTTIESWMCGKPSWIYDVNEYGMINGKELHQVPDDVDKFRADNVVKQIINEYKKII